MFRMKLLCNTCYVSHARFLLQTTAHGLTRASQSSAGKCHCRGGREQQRGPATCVPAAGTRRGGRRHPIGWVESVPVADGVGDLRAEAVEAGAAEDGRRGSGVKQGEGHLDLYSKESRRRRRRSSSRV
jgi:hypothetical protein